MALFHLNATHGGDTKTMIRNNEIQSITFFKFSFHNLIRGGSRTNANMENKVPTV